MQIRQKFILRFVHFLPRMSSAMHHSCRRHSRMHTNLMATTTLHLPKWTHHVSVSVQRVRSAVSTNHTGCHWFSMAVLACDCCVKQSVGEGNRDVIWFHFLGLLVSCDRSILIGHVLLLEHMLIWAILILHLLCYQFIIVCMLDMFLIKD